MTTLFASDSPKSFLYEKGDIMALYAPNRINEQVRMFCAKRV